jgi:hypothetical protein
MSLTNREIVGMDDYEVFCYSARITSACHCSVVCGSLNDLYRRVIIQRNNRLKRLMEIKAQR